MDTPAIVTVNKKADEKFLRHPAKTLNFSEHGKKELKELILKMKLAMDEANGIGLSANQIGINLKVFIAKPEKKFYVVINPEINKISEKNVAMEEGCLSVPEIYGEVIRPERIIVSGFNESGKKIKFKIGGLLARVFQHEIDHLNGALFVDKAQELYRVKK